MMIKDVSKGVAIKDFMEAVGEPIKMPMHLEILQMI